MEMNVTAYRWSKAQSGKQNNISFALLLIVFVCFSGIRAWFGSQTANAPCSRRDEPMQDDPHDSFVFHSCIGSGLWSECVWGMKGVGSMLITSEYMQ